MNVDFPALMIFCLKYILSEIIFCEGMIFGLKEGKLDSIAVSVFVDISVEFGQYRIRILNQKQIQIAI